MAGGAGGRAVHDQASIDRAMSLTIELGALETSPSRRSRSCIPNRGKLRAAHAVVFFVLLLSLQPGPFVMGAVPKWWYTSARANSAYGETVNAGALDGNGNIFFFGGNGYAAFPYYGGAIVKINLASGTASEVNRQLPPSGCNAAGYGGCLDSSGNAYLVGYSGWCNGYGPTAVDDMIIWSVDNNLGHRYEKLVQDTATGENLVSCSTDSTHLYSLGWATSSTVQGSVNLGDRDMILVKTLLSNGNLALIQRVGSTAYDSPNKGVFWVDSSTKAEFFISGTSNLNPVFYKIKASDLSTVATFAPTGTSSTTESPGLCMGYNEATGTLYACVETNGVLPWAQAGAVADPSSKNVAILTVDKDLSSVTRAYQVGGSGLESVSALYTHPDSSFQLICGMTVGDIDGTFPSSYPNTYNKGSYLMKIDPVNREILGAIQFSGDNYVTSCGSIMYLPATNQLVAGFVTTISMPTGQGFTAVGAAPISSGERMAIFSVEACQPGYYLDSTTWACVACTPGKYMSTPVGLGYCLDVPAGHYTSASAAAAAVPCPEGTYQSATGQTSCIPCAVGYMQPLTGQVACVKCDRGFYASTTGMASCERCPKNTFSGTTGATSCADCPNESFTLNSASTEPTDCMCIDGYYGDPHGRKGSPRPCKACPGSTKCPAQSYYPNALAGYWLDKASDPDSVFTCSPSSACTGDSECSTGYEGSACSYCASGYYRSKGYCNLCPWTAPFWVAVLVVILLCCIFLGMGICMLLAVCIVGKLLKRHERITKLLDYSRDITKKFSNVVSHVVRFAQLLAVSFAIPVDWPPAINVFKSIFFTINIININNILPAECYLGSSASKNEAIYYVKGFAPMFLGLILMGNFLVLWIAAALCGALRTKHKYFEMASNQFNGLRLLCGKVFVQSIHITYVFVCASAVSVFVCYEKTTGRYFMVSDPSEECFVGTGRWVKLVPAAVILYVIIGMGYPSSVMAVLVLCAKRKLLYTSDSVKYMIGFLYMNFEEKYYWWEVFTLFSKAFLTTCLVLSSVGMRDQLFFMSIVCFVMLLLHTRSMPFKAEHQDRAELNSLLALFVVFLCSCLISGDTGDSDTDLTTMTVVIIIILIISTITNAIGYYIYAFIAYDIGICALCKRARMTGHGKEGMPLVEDEAEDSVSITKAAAKEEALGKGIDAGSLDDQELKVPHQPSNPFENDETTIPPAVRKMDRAPTSRVAKDKDSGRSDARNRGNMKDGRERTRAPMAARNTKSHSHKDTGEKMSEPGATKSRVPRSTRRDERDAENADDHERRQTAARKQTGDHPVPQARRGPLLK